MNCDQVFDILTRAPFPAGQASDAAVEIHLAACHDCRRMAEALRPAVALFHEALDDKESVDLPRYRGNLATAGLPGLPQAVRQALEYHRPAPNAARTTYGVPAVVGPPSVRRAVPRNGWSVRVAAWRAAAVLLLAAGLLVALRHVGGEPEPAMKPARLAIDSAALRQLEQLQLPMNCRVSGQRLTQDPVPVESSAGASETAELVFQCCTRCHAADKPAVARPPAVEVLSSTCTLCHTKPADASLTLTLSDLSQQLLQCAAVLPAVGTNG